MEMREYAGERSWVGPDFRPPASRVVGCFSGVNLIIHLSKPKYRLNVTMSWQTSAFLAQQLLSQGIIRENALCPIQKIDITNMTLKLTADH